MIEIQDITVTAQRQPILEVERLRLNAGRMTVILGPNGAGKSTLLKVLSGEKKADRGTVVFQERDLKRWTLEKLARCRAVLSQQYHVSFPMRAHDLVKMGRYAHLGQRGETPEDERIVHSSLARMNASHLGPRFLASLSGGEQQRVQMARVLTQIWDDGSSQPRMLLLDEPTSSLDLVHQFSLLDVARSMADEGLCVVVVLHDINLAARYADDIVYLRGGRLVHAGPAEEMLSEEHLSAVYGISIVRVDDARLNHPYFITRPQPEVSFQRKQS